MDACMNCPVPQAEDGFLKEAPGGGLRSEASGVSSPEGPFVLPPPETGPLELKGFVSSDADLPEFPRPGWFVIADAEGVYGGVALSAGDALVCTGTNPAVWVPLAGGLASDIDASRLTGTAHVDTTGNAATADRVNHGFAVTGPGGQAAAFDGSAAAGLAVGDGLSLSVAGNVATVSQSPTGVAPGSYNSVTVGADGRVTAGSNPVTLAGHGIQDAYTKQEIDSRLTSGMHYRGSVPAYADLPSQDNVAGDFYNCVDTGNNYAWDGTEWDFVGNIIDFDPITLAEIDDITE
jgi:hypothetical protein